MEVRVDFDRCEANGVCVGIAPDIFELDDDDQLHITSAVPPADREEDVRTAIAQCPRAALTAHPCRLLPGMRTRSTVTSTYRRAVVHDVRRAHRTRRACS